MHLNRLILAAILFLTMDAKAQTGLDSVAHHFMEHVVSGRKEKIVVITDKAFYVAGETIWLRAWCIDSLSDRLIAKSKNLFVDLVDDRDSVVNQLLFNIRTQKTNGRILLPGSLKEGYYWLRGYTAGILKEDSNRIFVKPVYILNPNKSSANALTAYVQKTLPDAPDTAAPQLLFFPEGGSVIAGTTASFGFRCLSAKGTPLDISGYITDTRNDTVTKFSTSMPGMGKFSFDAFNPRKYFAHIRWNNRGNLIYPLPPIDQYASQLSVVEQTDHSLRMRVSLGDSLYKKHKVTYILGVSRDSLCFAATGTDMYDVNISNDNFPQGPATFFLFDQQDRLVSQRTVNMINSNSCRIEAATDKTVYGPGEKVSLDISVAPRYGHPIRALFSVSVTDDRLAANLTDELQQYTPEQISLLMLLYKDLYPDWKYTSDQMAAASSMKSPSSKDEDSALLKITGKAVSKNDQPLKSVVVNVLSGDNKIFKVDTTDANGRFLIHLPDFNDGLRFQLKLTDFAGHSQEGKIILDKFAFPKFNTPTGLKEGFSKSEVRAIRDFKIHRLTDTAISGKNDGLLAPALVTGEKPAAKYDQSKRVSQFSHIITSDALNNGGVNSLSNAIANVPGFNTGISSMKQNINSDGTTSMGMGVQPMVVMDGVPLQLSGTDVNSFLQSEVDPSTIDFIEILKGPLTAIYGVEGAGGVILINTRVGIDDVTKVNDKGIATVYPKGYFTQTDFKKAASPAQASTLYWNAHLLTDNNGKADLNFITANEQSTYSADIVGITENGQLISKKIRIKSQ
jgi:hypothetical protein